MTDAREAQLLAIIADLAKTIERLSARPEVHYGGGAGPNWSSGGGGGGSAGVSAVVRNIGSGGGGAGVALTMPQEIAS